ncbi:MAG: hypothetical protein QNI87_01430 [Erythrobacter sp.]|uniref:hypothetical protein n=1 Tax=Erythrobacter sp. TaxID=1042 RepID=UPI0026154903|nr:hypothetical protein [Erythrobacter sp.]MDJ0977176.1 hypothetical protein [Erythrobacter sp.]
MSDLDCAHHARSIVLLGEPGLGKSKTLKMMGDEIGVTPVRASTLSHSSSPASFVEGGVILVDGIDELASRKDGDALELVFARLRESGASRFVAACRSREWTAFAARGVEWAQPLSCRLSPLEWTEALELLRIECSSVEPEKVLNHLDNVGLAELYQNPLTLSLIGSVASKRTGLPRTRGELFDLATAQLVVEHDPERAPSALAELDLESALDAAGAAMAAILIAGLEAIADTGAVPSAQYELALGDIAKLPLATHISTVLSSKLFVSIGVGKAAPLHRVIAEFLGARWLSKTCRTKRVRRRLYEALTPGGNVPASLRGLHAWLVYHDDRFAQAAIDTDAYGLIRHGDVSLLSDTMGRYLLDSLVALGEKSEWFRASDWGSAPLGGLMRKSLADPVRELICSETIPFHTRSLIIESLAGTQLARDLRPELEEILANRAFSYHERAEAVDALFDFWDQPELAERLRTLSNLGDEDSTRIARRLYEKSTSAFPSELIVRVIVADFGLLASPWPKVRDQRSRTLRWSEPLIERIPAASAPSILDGLAAYIGMDPNLHWSLRSDFARIMAGLVAISLNTGHAGKNDAARIWSWLSAIDRLDRDRSDDIGPLIEALRNAEDVRRAVQDYALKVPLSEEELWRAEYDLAKNHVGLISYPGDAQRLLFECDYSNRLQPAVRRYFKDCLRIAYTADAGDLSEEANAFVARFVSGDEEYEAFLRKLINPPKQDWEKRQEKEAAKRARARRVAREWRRRRYGEDAAALRSGDVNALFKPASVYLGRIGNESHASDPNKRVIEWCDETTADILLVGLETFLKASLLLDPKAVSNSLASGGYCRWRYVVYAAMVAREIAGCGYEDLAQDRRFAMLMVCHDEGSYALNHKLLGQALQRLETETIGNPKERQAFIDEWLGPSIVANRRHIPGLYMMARKPEWRTAAIPLAAKWLSNCPDIDAVTELELIDILVSASEHKALADIARARDERVFPDIDRMLTWLAIDIMTRFDEVEDALGTLATDHPDFLWFLRNRFQPERHGPLGWTSVDSAAWIIDAFRTLWPHERLEGSGSGDCNGYDATNFLEGLIDRIAGEIEPAAIGALGSLADAPTDSYTPKLRLAEASQQQAVAGRLFVPLPPQDLSELLADGPPATAVDLKVLVLETLEEAQAAIRGDDLDTVDLFWTDEGKPRTENECRDRLAGLISPKLENYNVLRMTEADMPAGKRADLAFAIGQIQLPLEAKGQWHDEVWDAAEGQLADLYLRDWRSNGLGIYLVFWFGDVPSATGRRLKLHPDGDPAPHDTSAMADMLRYRLPPDRRRDITIVVLDCRR